jgi:hypothetical protein
VCTPETAVINDDVVNVIVRPVEGFEVNDETLAPDLIEEVGPVPGTFPNKKHANRILKDARKHRRNCDLD